MAPSSPLLGGAKGSSKGPRRTSSDAGSQAAGENQFSETAIPLCLFLVFATALWCLQPVTEGPPVFMARAGFGPAAQPPLDIVIKEESSLTVVRSGLVDLTDPKCPFHGLQDGLFHPSVARPRFIATGGAGFIGSHLVKKLRETYPAEQIKVVDNLWRGHLRNLQYEDGSWAISPIRDFCQMDLTSAEHARRYLRGVDYVYHLADVVAGVAYVFGHQESVFRSNVLINTNTLTSCKQNGVPNYIYVGTACSFPQHLQMGPGIHALRENQTYPAGPESSYGWSKLMGEYEAELAKSPGVFNVGILRLHNVYGPHSDYLPTSVQAIPSLIRKALRHASEEFVVWGSGKQYRDFIFVDDVIRGLLLLKDKGMNRGAIQVGSGRATTLLELATTVAEVTKATLGVDLEPVFDLTKPEGDRGRVAVYDRAAEILGWQPTVPLLQGLETTLAWMQTNMDAPRVLVVLIGQPRGGNLAWKSLRKHLLRPYNAHLALFFTDESPTDTLLHKMAQYVWTVPEYEDWGVVWDEVARTTCPGRPVGDWRRLCGIPNQWMGGIDQCGHPAGSGILLAFRWLVQQKLAGSLLLDKYDYMVFSRADELYLCDHVDLFPVEDPGRIFLPFGEGYGGLWDRHLVGATPTFMRAINLTTELVCNTDYWYEILSKIESVNLEKVQMHMWANMSLPVGEFNRSMFTVKKDDDPTRWLLRWQNHKDQATKEFDLTVKYPQEMVDAVQHCNVNATLTIRKLQAED